MTYFIAPNPYRMARRWAHMAGFEPSRDFTLAVDVREEDDAYVLSALVPGLKADDLNIQILDDVVTIEGEFKADESEYLVRELPHGSVPPDPCICRLPWTPAKPRPRSPMAC